ncbi:hypothetical protein BESB_025080 [Besnoitia besnoiti]|uniref:Uncharacterized protein n=1 Tax=Besnoitia besnoiti TaxID=94643 RepID=A0A2A9M824_BESBE|nr:uncharacterized protein BESB_025080 [Besnoitia besnoiti]PFH31542.1 hypothetical protein BESB_025080 [Besnoitia besnoiti]
MRKEPRKFDPSPVTALEFGGKSPISPARPIMKTGRRKQAAAIVRGLKRLYEGNAKFYRQVKLEQTASVGDECSPISRCMELHSALCTAASRALDHAVALLPILSIFHNSGELHNSMQISDKQSRRGTWGSSGSG